MNNIYLDVLHMRRPPLRYVSPAICDAVFSSTSFPILTLDALPVQPSITGLRITFIGLDGDFELTWDDYPGAICYTVYKLNDANDRFGAFTIIAECITDPIYRPDEHEDPFDPEDPSCYIVSAITLQGEVALSDPICTDNDGDGNPDIPDGPPPIGGCILNSTPLPDGVVGEPYSTTLLPDGPASGPQWTVVAGALPDGTTLDINSGQISGTPTVPGVFTFTVRLTKDGGGFCEKEFSIEILSVCLDPQPPIGIPSVFAGCYDSTNDRMVFLSGVSDLVVVDAATDTVISTTGAGFGFIVGGISFAPSTNLVYFNGHDGLNPVVGVFDAATSTMMGTIAVPPGVINFLSGEHTYDAVNDRVYIPVQLTNPTADSGLLAVNPVAGTSSLLISLSSPPGENEFFGFRVAYSDVNDRIFIPTVHFDGVNNSTYISVYSTAGALVSTIPISSPSSPGPVEAIFYNQENSLLYYIGGESVAGGPGLRILDPTDNSTVASFSSSPDVDSWICFTDGAANVIDNNGDVTRRHATDHSILCSQNIVVGFSTRMESRQGGKIYSPNVVTGQVAIFE